MFKHFFNKLNSNKNIGEKGPEILTYTNSYDELFGAISTVREPSVLKDELIINENIESEKKTFTIAKGVEITEMDDTLYIKGTSLDLQLIADELQTMEFWVPGEVCMFGEWRFLVTDGAVMSSPEEKFFALPPDEWLMMGCKFNDAISGYDVNPYTFFCSPFGNYKLPYGIQIFITDYED